jgi:spermidine/putrescine transport system ATP-binding protein
VREPAGRDGAGPSDLRIVGVTKRFGVFAAVDDLTLTVPAGSFFALLGPSGCGKTTTLRMVAGLEKPTDGRILLGDDDVTELRPYQRPVNTVFQSYALFPHLTITENVAFGLRRRGVKRVLPQVEEMLELVELSGFGKRKPAQLSGGQQQRVALARALINRPQLLLLDEPLGALDLKLRRQMQIELKRIQTEVGITFVHVTHDQEEAMTMADSVAVMNGGRVEQLGAPMSLYERPSTVFVANFLGQSNLVPGRRVARSERSAVIDCDGQRVAVPADRMPTDAGDRLLVGVRPEKIELRTPGGDSAATGNRLTGGVVVDASFTGVSTQYLVRLPSGQNAVVVAQNLGLGERFPPGTAVELAWDVDHTFALPIGPAASDSTVVDVRNAADIGSAPLGAVSG